QGEPRRYQLTVAEAGELVIELASRDFDAVLELHGEDGLVAEDDDGGDASNARITARVEPGTYTIVARGYGEHGRGLFELGVRLRRSTPPCQAGADASPAPASNPAPPTPAPVCATCSS